MRNCSNRFGEGPVLAAGSTVEAVDGAVTLAGDVTVLMVPNGFTVDGG